MPVLKNARHERYSQEIAKGKNQTEAYELAGYKPSRHHAARLATLGTIRQRIDEILGKAAARVEVTIASVTNMLVDANSLAMQCKQTSAAVQAARSIGELHGLFVERVKTEIEHRFVARIPDKTAESTAWQIEHTPEQKTVN